MQDRILGKERKRVPVNVRFNMKTTQVGELKKMVLEALGKPVNDKTLKKARLIKNGTFLQPDEAIVEKFLSLKQDASYCNRHVFGWKKSYVGSLWLVPNHIEPSNDGFYTPNQGENEKEKVVEGNAKKTLKGAIRKYQISSMLLRDPMKWKKKDGRAKLGTLK